MRIKIIMISGREIVFENTKAKSILEFIKSQFESKKGFIWYSPFRDKDLVLNFENIESIEESSQ